MSFSCCAPRAHSCARSYCAPRAHSCARLCFSLFISPAFYAGSCARFLLCISRSFLSALLLSCVPVRSYRPLAPVFVFCFVHCPGILCRLFRPFFIVHFALIFERAASFLCSSAILSPACARLCFSSFISPAFYAGYCARFLLCISRSFLSALLLSCVPVRSYRPLSPALLCSISLGGVSGSSRGQYLGNSTYRTFCISIRLCFSPFISPAFYVGMMFVVCAGYYPARLFPFRG